MYTLCANMTLPTREVPSEVSVIPDLCQPTVRRQDLVLLVNVDNLNNMQMKNQFCEISNPSIDQIDPDFLVLVC